jgi:F-type H+-transporting ATPase subunit b
MLIDWFTVCAQALNFFVLVWLMKRYLYRPILNAIDTREKRIASQLADAKTQKGEAKRDKELFEQKISEFDKQTADLVSKATDGANEQGQKIIDDAKKQADVLSAARAQALLNDVKHLDKDLASTVQNSVFGITRKALAEMADESLEECLVTVFIRRLKDLDVTGKNALKAAVQDSSDPAEVRSAFELAPKQQSAIKVAIHTALATDVSLRFAVQTDLISGIEFVANGQKVAWALSDYVSTLETTITDLVNQQIKKPTKTEQKVAVTSK